MALQPEQPSNLIGSIQSEVTNEASGLFTFLVKYSRAIFAFFILFIIAIGVYWGYSNYKNKQMNAERQKMGTVLFSKQGEELLTALTSYAATAPDSTQLEAYTTIAALAMDLKKYPEAYQAWEKVSTLQPQLYPDAIIGMASALAAQGENSKALALLETAAPRVPASYEKNISGEIVILAENLKDYSKAIMYCQKLANHPQPDDRTSYWKLKLAALQLAASASTQQ